MKVSDIIIPPRKRSLNEAKVQELAASMAEIGLLNPVTVTTGDRLIAGYHRVEAAKRLGWDDIPAHTLPGDPLLHELAEIDENLIRNELTDMEQGQHLNRRDEILTTMGKRAPNHRPEKGDIMSPLQTTASIAAEVGLSERDAQRRKQVARDIIPEVQEEIKDSPVADRITDLLELARVDPDTQRKAAAKIMNNVKTVREAIRQVRGESFKEATPFPSDKYRVIYADPPWQYGNTMPEEFHEQRDHYPTMTIKELCDLPIREIAEDNAVLFLWATSPILEEAFQVVHAWGFQYKSSFVWDKVKHVMGHYNSVRHEFLLVCTRGSCQPDVRKLYDSVITEESTEHSRKPAVIRTIIDTIYPHGRRIELFSREVVDGWSNYGNEITLP